MSKETQINFYDGLNAADGAVVAQRALDVFSDPGITGQITLTTDPQLLDGTGFARQKITAGKAILVQGLFGNRNGTLFHITEHSFSNDSNTVNLTIDSKYRDQLTVQEVRKRGKDSLIVSQLLGLGKYQPSINDLLFPWSYELGAGYLPKFSQSLWTNTNKDGISVGSFPWLNLTKNYPPSKENPAGSNGSSSGAYAYIPIADTTNADKNWSAPIPIVFSAKGNINNVRFAAYKADGSLYPVPFHVSLWYLAVTPSNMPQIPSPGGPDTWFQATNNTKSTGSPLSATLTVAATTAAATVNVSLKFSNNAKPFLSLIAKSLPRLKINDATLIKTYKNKEVPAYTVSTSKLTITWKIPKAEAKYKVKKSKTVSKIFALTQYSSTPAGNGLIPEGFSYGWGDHYPFFKGAWETITQEGNTRPNDNTISTNTPIIGWGNYYEQAGYYPNSGGNAQTSAYQPPTGIFVDDTVFSYDFISGRGEIKEQETPAANQAAGIGVVTGYAMFYCDQEWDGTELVPRKEAVYFIGRLYRQPPGA